MWLLISRKGGLLMGGGLLVIGRDYSILCYTVVWLSQVASPKCHGSIFRLQWVTNRHPNSYICVYIYICIYIYIYIYDITTRTRVCLKHPYDLLSSSLRCGYSVLYYAVVILVVLCYVIPHSYTTILVLVY